MDVESIVDIQKAIYGSKKGPPILPHGDDPKAIRPLRRKKRVQERYRSLPVSASRTSSSLLPASELPAGFPPQLAFRALAAYSLLRTLSVPLRLSPFTPAVFLRALYLPAPNPLLGRIHVALLRFLLRNLHMGYHWGEGSSKHNATVKKRKIDGLRWPLRATDNLQYLDTFSWPVYFDDFCHLTADMLYAAINDENDYTDVRSLDISHVPDCVYDLDKHRGKRPRVETVYLHAPQDESDKVEWPVEEFQEDDDDSDDSYDVRRSRTKSPGGKGRKRGRPRKNKNPNAKKSSNPSKISQKTAASACYYPQAANYPYTHHGAGGVVARTGPVMTYSSYIEAHRILSSGGRLAPEQYAAMVGMMRMMPFSGVQTPFVNAAFARPPPPVTTTSASHGSRYATGSNNRPSESAKGAYSVESFPRPMVSTVTSQSSIAVSTVGAQRGSVAAKAADKVSPRKGSPRKTPSCLVQDLVELPLPVKKPAPCPVSVEPSRMETTPNGLSKASSAAESAAIKVSLSASMPATAVDPFKSTQTSSLGETPNTGTEVNGTSAVAIKLTAQPLANLNGAHVRRPTEKASESVSTKEMMDSPQKDTSTTGANTVPKEQNITRSPHVALCKLTVEGTKCQDGALTKRKREKVIAGASAVNPKQAPTNEGIFTGVAKKTAQMAREDKMAAILDGFMRGDDISSLAADGDKEIDAFEAKQDASSSIKEAGSEDSLREWPQFKALQSMRRGKPYHHLPIEEKLSILEFLLDELLSVDAIANEMSLRESKTACFDVPFAKIPTADDLEHMYNDDNCGICRREGELLCCDGCISSYHRDCVGLPKTGGLPEGKWYCPECVSVDPAMFGPLYGGRKACLEWCDTNDLKRCSEYSCLIRAGDEKDAVAFAVNEHPPISRNQSKRRLEFLYVHGFSFLRDPSKGFDRPLPPLSPSNLIQHLTLLGPKLSSSWPVAQIPLPQSALKDISVLPLAEGHRYMKPHASFNPFLYENKYQKAPLFAGVGKLRNSHSFDYETRCNATVPIRLSDALKPDFSVDDGVAKALRSSHHIYNPYEMLQTYMLGIQHKLLKAALLDVSWGAGKPKDKSILWKQNVTVCRSLRKLGKMLLFLVDSIHSRAFLDSWHGCETSKAIRPLSPEYSGKPFLLPEDQDPKMLSRAMLWKTCPSSAITSLLARECQNLHDWIRENRPDLAPSTQRHKRKRVKEAVATLRPAPKIPQGTDESLRAPQATDMESLAMMHATQDDLDKSEEDDEEGRPTKRLRSSRHTLTSSSVDGKTAETSMKSGLDKLRQEKISDVVEGMTGPFMAEPAWPVAGNKLFPPRGLLPNSTTRFLSRNAGSVLAENVVYSDQYEVGQVSFCHAWRKKVLLCHSYEELAFLVRVLEGHLDMTVVKKCTSLANKYKSGKTQPQSLILCSHRDLGTGSDAHLVFKVKQRTCTWLPTSQIELQPLVVDQLRRNSIVAPKISKPSYFQKRQIDSNRIDATANTTLLSSSSNKEKGDCKTAVSTSTGSLKPSTVPKPSSQSEVLGSSTGSKKSHVPEAPTKQHSGRFQPAPCAPSQASMGAVGQINPESLQLLQNFLQFNRNSGVATSNQAPYVANQQPPPIMQHYPQSQGMQQGTQQLESFTQTYQGEQKSFDQVAYKNQNPTGQASFSSSAQGALPRHNNSNAQCSNSVQIPDLRHSSLQNSGSNPFASNGQVSNPTYPQRSRYSQQFDAVAHSQQTTQISNQSQSYFKSQYAGSYNGVPSIGSRSESQQQSITAANSCQQGPMFPHQHYPGMISNQPTSVGNPYQQNGAQYYGNYLESPYSMPNKGQQSTRSHECTPSDNVQQMRNYAQQTSAETSPYASSSTQGYAPLANGHSPFSVPGMSPDQRNQYGYGHQHYQMQQPSTAGISVNPLSFPQAGTPQENRPFYPHGQQQHGGQTMSANPMSYPGGSSARNNPSHQQSQQSNHAHFQFNTR